MKPKIQILVGMIASGKSSYTKNAARAGAICVNDDAIVNMLHGDEYTLYDTSLKVLYKTIENQIVGTALAMKRTVIIDRGLNVSAQGRQRWIALAKSFDVSCEAIRFHNDGAKVHARRRSDTDARGHDYQYWLDVAQYHESIYSPPVIEEGLSKVHYISFEEILAGKVIE